MIASIIDICYIFSNIYILFYLDTSASPLIFTTMRLIDTITTFQNINRYTSSISTQKSQFKHYLFMSLFYFIFSKSITEVFLKQNYELYKILDSSQILFIPFLVGPFLKLEPSNQKFLSFTSAILTAFSHIKHAASISLFTWNSTIMLFFYFWFIKFCH